MVGRAGRYARSGFLSLALGALPGAVLALDKDEADFILGNTVWTVLHEVAHLLIDQLGLPVLGQEEDAADNFATVTLLDSGRAGDATALMAAAEGWMATAEAAADHGDEIPFWDEHGVDEQRGYQMLCLMAAANEVRFGLLAQRYELPEERLESCGLDYDLARDSWDLVLEPFAPLPGEKADLTVIYEAPTAEEAPYAALLAQRRDLEIQAEALRRRAELPFPAALRFVADCEGPDAWYDPDAPEIIVCYALLAEFHRLHKRLGHP